MKEQNLLPNEKIITTTSNNSIVLTSHRIRQVIDKSITSILLRNISSINVKYSENGVLLLISILSLIGIVYGIHISEMLIVVASGIVGILFLFLFFKSRTHNIVITPKGGKSILFITKGMKNRNVLELINKVEKAIIEESK